MELQNQLKELASKIDGLKDRIGTEESTKHAFVLPFIQILGYDIFDPTEVVPEFIADIGIKKGEKVDYAIFQNGIPIIIIECKNWREDLNVHNSQLFRYFHVTKTRFSLLTNGIEYRFYTDLENTNKMDEKPFLEFNVCEVKENTVNEIAKFHKSRFDVDKIVDNASSLKYTKEIRKVFNDELQKPSEEFIRYFASRVYSGNITARVVGQFEELVQRALNQVVSDKVNDRLTSALSKEAEVQEETGTTEALSEVVSKVTTTEEEMDAFRIIVAILRRRVSISRIAQRDTQSYFGVLLDDNNRKPLCRLHLNGGKKYIGLFDEAKNETRELLETVDDIYNFEDQLLKTLDHYENV
jgi:hypothetical protein